MKFFRKIRQKLLSENEFSKYLIYAIGEIFLVVIGILIALNINNWNENRKAHIQNIEFLENLKVELSIDISAYEDRRLEYQQINDRIKKTIALFNRGNLKLTTDERATISNTLTSFQILTPINKNSNRNDFIIAQGTIDKIDHGLNRAFLTYLENTQSVNAIVTKLGETLQQLELLQVHPNVDYHDIDVSFERAEFDFTEIANHRGIRNALERSYGYRSYYMDEMSKKIAAAKKLTKLIDQQLTE